MDRTLDEILLEQGRLIDSMIAGLNAGRLPSPSLADDLEANHRQTERANARRTPLDFLSGGFRRLARLFRRRRTADVEGHQAFSEEALSECEPPQTAERKRKSRFGSFNFVKKWFSRSKRQSDEGANTGYVDDELTEGWPATEEADAEARGASWEGAEEPAYQPPQQLPSDLGQPEAAHVRSRAQPDEDLRDLCRNDQPLRQLNSAPLTFEAPPRRPSRRHSRRATPLFPLWRDSPATLTAGSAQRNQYRQSAVSDAPTQISAISPEEALNNRPRSPVSPLLPPQRASPPPRVSLLSLGDDLPSAQSLLESSRTSSQLPVLSLLQASQSLVTTTTSPPAPAPTTSQPLPTISVQSPPPSTQPPTPSLLTLVSSLRSRSLSPPRTSTDFSLFIVFTPSTARIRQPPVPFTQFLRRLLRRRPAMDPTRLAPEPATGDKKQQAMQDAKDMYKHTVRTCEKLQIPVPPYDFLELIGKGGSGRVYKCRDRKTGDLVAVKIVDTDMVDYSGHVLDKDNTIKDFQKEVATLQRLKEGQAQNINIIHDAYEIGQNLWIVSDYCTGGSVRTLMRAMPPGNPGLEEHYIVPIARELLVALADLHSMGIIHRDIKATNVYITETGALQLGDYGVVGVIDDQTNKRKTILGTPHWMPRELLAPTEGDQTSDGYGAEIDIWAFGCTLFEMATGAPPNARLPMERLTRALLKAPRLEGKHHSEQLRDFVAFCLDNDPQQRPTAAAALQHPFVANTQKQYPTSSLVKLIERYKLWEYGGGIRQSLFLQGGAPPIPAQVEEEEPEEEDTDDWNFSTSESFNTDFQQRFSHMLAIGSQGLDFNIGGPVGTTKGPQPLHPESGSRWDALQAELAEQRVDLAGESLARLYRLSASEYKLHTPLTESERDNKPAEDLPLRSSTQDTEAQESVVDLDEADYDPNAPFNFDFVDATTLKARKSRRMSVEEDDEENYQYGRDDGDVDKRATRDWKFPTTSKKVVSPKRATMDWTFASARPAEPDEPDAKMELPPRGDGHPPPAFRPTLKHTQTMPLGEAGDYIHATQSYRPPTSPIRDSMASMIDLDMGMVDMGDDTEISRPGTAISTTGSHFSDMTSGNPFDLEEDPNQNELDRNRFSYHKQWQSEGGQVDRHSRRSIPMHTRGSSLSSTDNEIERRSNGLTYQIRNDRVGKNSKIVVEDNIDLDSWPNFDQPGIERVSSAEGGVVHVRQQSSVASTANGRLGSRRLAFPSVVGPSAASLDEHAPPALLAAEMERLFDGLAESLQVTSRAFEQHSGLEEDGGWVSGSESGWEAGGVRSGDEV